MVGRNGGNGKMPYEVIEEIKGVIVGVRQVQDRGRVQIPKKIREEMKLRDGDAVYWVRLNGRYYIVKARELK
jgi:AbrB family looped-hinge helix DNA binding protein